MTGNLKYIVLYYKILLPADLSDINDTYSYLNDYTEEF